MADWKSKYNELLEILEGHAKFLDRFNQSLISKEDYYIGVEHFKGKVDKLVKEGWEQKGISDIS